MAQVAPLLLMTESVNSAHITIVVTSTWFVGDTSMGLPKWRSQRLELLGLHRELR
jgi:hypothetical protein